MYNYIILFQLHKFSVIINSIIYDYNNCVRTTPIIFGFKKKEELRPQIFLLYGYIIIKLSIRGDLCVSGLCVLFDPKSLAYSCIVQLIYVFSTVYEKKRNVKKINSLLRRILLVDRRKISNN